MLAKATLIACLAAAALASAHLAAAGAARTVSSPVKAARLSSPVARAAERTLLLMAPREKLLRRFVDRTTGLVERNVAVHCTRFRGQGPHKRLHRFLCRVWVLPRRPSSGVAVVCHTAHHTFRVTAYHRRHRTHRG